MCVLNPAVKPGRTINEILVQISLDSKKHILNVFDHI